MTAPERIWAFCPDIFDNMSVWQDQPSPAGDSIEYLRADVADAAVAAAYEAAARWHNENSEHDQHGLDYSALVGIPISNAAELASSVKMHTYSADHIRALTPADAKVALEAVRREERQFGIPVAAALAAAISLLERGGKQAAASDKMFDQMLTDYQRALDDYRALIDKETTE